MTNPAMVLIKPCGIFQDSPAFHKQKLCPVMKKQSTNKISDSVDIKSNKEVKQIVKVEVTNKNVFQDLLLKYKLSNPSLRNGSESKPSDSVNLVVSKSQKNTEAYQLGFDFEKQSEKFTIPSTEDVDELLFASELLFHPIEDEVNGEIKDNCFEKDALFRVAESLLLLRETDITSKFCIECRKFVNGKLCSKHGNPTQRLKQTLAVRSIPCFMSIQETKIPSAGLGVFALAAYDMGSMFGPMDGEILDEEGYNARENKAYVWEIYNEPRTKIIHYLDCQDESKSNWMRFVNCARFEEEQNLIAEQYEQSIYYKVYKRISPGEELLVWYGNAYGLQFCEQFNEHVSAEQIMEDDCAMDVPFPDEIAHEEVVLDRNEMKMKSKNYCKKRKNEHCENKFQCSSCNTSFSSNEYLQQHLNSGCHLAHPYQCQKCGLKLKNQYTLRNHMKTHKLTFLCHKCDVCAMVFKDKTNLKNHRLAVHMKIKEFRCEFCDRNFARASNLRSHVLTVHNKEKPYVCNTCRRCFGRLDALKRHERSHNDARNVDCKFCGACYNTRNSLLCHTRKNHPPDKEARSGICCDCNRTFYDLDVHWRIIHRGRSKAVVKKEKLEEVD